MLYCIPYDPSSVMVTSFVHITQEIRGAATGSVARAPYCQGAILPGRHIAWHGTVGKCLPCSHPVPHSMIVQHHGATSITQPDMHWMQHHARQANAQSCKDSISCSKERPSGQKFAKQAWIPRCTSHACATYQLCLRVGLDAYFSGHHSRSASLP